MNKFSNIKMIKKFSNIKMITNNILNKFNRTYHDNKQLNIINTLHETPIRLIFGHREFPVEQQQKCFFTHGGEMLLKLSNSLNSK